MPPAPDFAIELQSQGQTVSDLTDEANDYLAGGVALVWVIYPDKEMAHIFRPGLVSPQIVTLAGELDAEAVIPGFKVPMNNLFKKTSK
jgi:Uma2 family endonuclease